MTNDAPYSASRGDAAGPPVIAVCGLKNAGKTTLLCGLIPLLRDRGLKVAAAKHDGHDFVPDVPATDSFRLRRAGAEAVAVFSPHRYLVTVERPDPDWGTILGHLREADLILLEGGKSSPFPKIEIIRGEVAASSVCDPATLLAVCTDTEAVPPAGVPRLALEDYRGLAEVVWRHIAVVSQRN